MKANSLVPKLRIFTRESEVRGERPAKNYLKSRFEVGNRLETLFCWFS
jgi:hypothetical protein